MSQRWYLEEVQSEGVGSKSMAKVVLENCACTNMSSLK